MGHAELQPEDVDESITPLVAAIKRTWSAFCATSSIHGLKYTKDEETNKYIRWVFFYSEAKLNDQFNQFSFTDSYGC